MTLDPQIAGLIDALDGGFPAVHTMTGAQARATIRSRFTPAPRPEPVAAVQELRVPVDGTSIRVRVYRPAGEGAVPALVFAHGGGFVFCDLESHDGLCRNLTNRLGAVVVSVDYRRAPEDRWPTAAEDMYAAVRWVADNAAELGIDAGRIAVGGDSAGGNLAAVTALMARDRGGPALRAQLLLYPVIAADFDTESYRLFGQGFYNPEPALRWYWDQYVPELADRRHPYAVPLHAELAGLPPAVMVTTGHDPLRDEAFAYAQALTDAGVAVTRCEFGGAVHGFMTMPMLDICHEARRRSTEELAALLRG
ncbi:alpha/beta hydrolase [Mycolicibacterium parafortuitum]|uniref:Sterase / lipase [Rhodococcus jostii RHA1] n=1 Tax=Mycolicibacterium parafortuitum TaxID=39692 RepID=A0A375YI31_MYCPF|nr:alpha/beta hydrolase [Mycolicibacterium parafortuitum]ORB30494.1 esterase [Mycolicibacterium parafortuitum]SRX80787.1 sterase / lipase [Rhodococcus jostii RHA1] [Mycolicibacterium parafortuitum]